MAGMSVTPVSGSLWVGTIGAADQPVSSVTQWAAPFGAGRASVDGVYAPDKELRRTMVGFGMAAAWRDGGVRLVTAPSGPGGLYQAGGPGLRVWATHAVAAAFLATGSVELDPAAIPELIAFDFTGSTRSKVRGATPVAPASRIDLSAAELAETCFWPSPERWAQLPEDEAHRHTETTLLESLEVRTGSKRVGLALTAGADSRVLAVALHELGKKTAAFCWGDSGWPDVEGARTVAEELGMPFTDGARWRNDGEMRAIFDGEVRLSDGRAILSPSEREWPEQAQAIALGAAGEVGRTFYYRRHVSEPEPHEPAELARFLRVEARLPAATPEAHAAAGTSVAAWLEQAGRSGLSGWRLLDVLYAEQRVGCWGLIQIPALEADIVAGFSPQQVVRGLASLPLSERASDGFHRRFVANRHPKLALQAQPEPTRPTPRWRHEIRRRFGRRRRGQAGDPLLLSLWSERHDTRDWVTEEVLRAPLVTDALGSEWAERTLEGFLAGRRRAAEQAAVAAAPVALQAAVKELAGS
jgi:hypothetical protein